MKAQEILRTAIITIVIIVITTTLSYLDVMKTWDKETSDILNQKVSNVNKDIYIIGIDDKTLEEYGFITSWGRELSGQLVEKLMENPESKPAVIGFDVIYSEKVDEEGDLYFAKACGEAGNVVVANTFIFKEQPETDKSGNITYNPLYVEQLVQPYETLQNNVSTGFANTCVDSDGYVRQSRKNIEYNGENVYSFACEIYKQFQESRGEKVKLPDTYGKGNQFFFSYSGKPGSYTVMSMADVLDGTVDTRIFKDSIVLIGAYAVGMQDSFRPAVQHGGEMNGVEIHANIIQALMDGKTQVPISKGLYAIFIGVLCGAFFLFTRKVKIQWATVGLVLLSLGNVMFVKIMYQNGYILPVLLLPIVLLVIYAEQLIEGYVTEHMRRRRVVSVFKQYVAPQVVDKISKDKDYELVLGGENRHIAVLFVDIRGFTTMSESLEPEQVVEILNEYLSLITKAIFDNKGTLDKFTGDGAMAVFNAPFDLEDYIFRSVCAAWDIKQNTDVLKKRIQQSSGKNVEIGIGINCGNAVVGNIGCDFRMDYTTIGDTVNTAARLENNAEQGQILISEDVYEEVKDRVEVTPIGEIPLKGKIKGVFVYQVDKVVRTR